MGVEILITGSRFLGSGFRSLEPVISELVRSACFEIQIASYRFAPAVEFLQLLEKALARGIKLTLILDSVKDQPEHVREWIIDMRAKHPHFVVVDFHITYGENLHAKILVVDRKKAVVGSANFTWGGLVTNHEICLLVEGKTASEIASLLDRITKTA